MQLTPAQVQQRLYDVHQQMVQAASALARARTAEVEAERAFVMARSRAITSGDCPRPKRGENGVTVADRDAWVDQQVEDERFTLAVAEATRKAAEDNLRVTRDQASLVQSLSALMRAEMSLAGTPA